MKKIIHYFVAEKLKSDKELFRKAAFASAACLLIEIITVFAVAYAAYVIPEPTYITIGISFNTTILASLFVFKKTGSFTFMALFVCGISFLALTAAAIATGGIYSPDVYSLLIIPVFALTISNRTITIFWTIMVILVFVTLYAVEETGMYQLKHLTEQVPVFYYFQDTMIFSAILLFLIFRNEFLRLQLLGEVKQSHEEISNKSKEITDSITYARRIQKAQMTNEKMIDKTIGRLKNKN